MNASGLEQLASVCLQIGAQLGGGQHNRWLGILHNGRQPLVHLSTPGWIGGDGHDFGIKAAHKGADKLEARWIEQQGAFAGGDMLLKRRRDCPRPLIQFAKAKIDLVVLAIAQKSFGNPLRMQIRARAQESDPFGGNRLL